ncbi:MAG: YggT family protein, partial [Roseiflexaceae bacterium]
VIMSWIDQPGSMRITQILNEVTEPILAPLRSIIPSVGMFDLTPIIAMLLLQLLEGLVRGAVMGG